MARVFVSYSRKDIEFAKRLTAELQRSELDFWIDWEGIPPTVDWWKEIEKGIEEADVFLFLISPDSAKSKVCGQEIDTAVKNGKRIIPIVVREIEWQDTPPQLGHLNYIFFSRDDDFATASNKLIAAIQTDYEWTATHRRLQVKALDWEKNGKDNGFLLRGRDLLDAEQDLATNTSKDPHPTDLQREYVHESRKTTDRQRRILTAASIVAAMALAALAAFGLYQANESQNRANIARAEGLASLSLVEKERQSNLALLLSAEGYRRLKDSLRTQGALLSLADSYPGLEIFLSGHTDTVRTVTFSPDGRYLASGGDDGLVILWDVHEPKAPSQFLKLPGYDSYFSDVTFSPDGQRLAWGSENGTINLCNVDDPDNLMRLVPQDRQRMKAISTVTFSPDGGYVAATDFIGNFLLWDIRDPAGPAEVTTPISAYSAAFSPDGKTLATGGDDGTIVLWNIGDPTRPRQIDSSSEHAREVDRVVFDHDGKQLASASRDGVVMLWEIRDGKLGAPVQISSERIHLSNIVFSPDDSRLAWGAKDDFSAVLWRRDESEGASPLKLVGHSNSVLSVSFSPDSRHLASASVDGSVILWDLDRLTPPSQLGKLSFPWELGVLPIVTFAFSPDGDWIAAGTLDGTIQLTEARNSSHSLQLDTVPGMPVDILAFSRTGKRLASGNGAGSIFVWNLSTSTAPPPLEITAGSPANSLAFSPDENHLASGHANGTMIVWDIRNPASIHRLAEISEHSSAIRSIVFSPDGKQIVSGSSDGAITLIDVSDPEAPRQLAGSPEKDASFSADGAIESFDMGLSFSADGRRSAAAIGDGRIALLAINTPAHASRLDTRSRAVINTLALSPDGKLLANGDANGNVFLWDISNAASPSQLARISGNPSGILSVAFSSDGKRLASGIFDGSILLTDISNPRTPFRLALLSTVPGWVDLLAFSPDDTTLASRHGGDMLVLWDLDPESWREKNCQRAGRNLSRAEWAQYLPGVAYPTNAKDATCPQWSLDDESTLAPGPNP